MNDKILKHCTKLIQSEISFMNGWRISEHGEKEACKKAAEKVIKYLKKKIEEEYESCD